MIILGIDPGLANTGWGVIDAVQSRYRPISFGVISTDAKTPIPLRINAIAEQVKILIEKYSVNACAIEEIYFTKNITSAISVAKVIGAISHEAVRNNLNVEFFSPLQVKNTITGIGNADKNQVGQLIKILLGLDKIPKPDHAADALAISVTYAIMNQSKTKIGALK